MKREFTLLNEVVVSETKGEFSSDSDSQIQNYPSGRRPGPLLVSLASLESLPADSIVHQQKLEIAERLLFDF